MLKFRVVDMKKEEFREYNNVFRFIFELLTHKLRYKIMKIGKQYVMFL